MGCLPSSSDRVIPHKGPSALSKKRTPKEDFLPGALNRCSKGLYSPKRHKRQSTVIHRMSRENAAPRRSSAQPSQLAASRARSTWESAVSWEWKTGETNACDPHQTAMHHFSALKSLHCDCCALWWNDTHAFLLIAGKSPNPKINQFSFLFPRYFISKPRPHLTPTSE